MENDFLPENSFKDFNEIIDIIVNDSLNEKVLSIEHIGDIIFLLNKYDRNRSNDDPELKMAVFTVVRHLLENKLALPNFNIVWNDDVKKNPPKTVDEIFRYLDESWNLGDELERAYLMGFIKGSINKTQ